MKTPVRPSAKALGKRKVVELPPDDDRTCSASKNDAACSYRFTGAFDPNDIFYNHPNDSFHNNTNNNSEESESEEGRARNPWHRPVHYVYDAAAERTQQRIREGRLASAALVSGALVGGVH